MEIDTIFSRVYKKELQTVFSDLEIQRKKTKWLIIRSFIPFLIKTLIISGGLIYVSIWGALNEFNVYKDYEVLLATFGFILFILLLTTIFFFKKKKEIYQTALYESDYYKSYKKKVVGKICSSLYKDLSYNPEAGIPEQSFRESGFPLFYNPASYYSSDSIFGKIGQTNVHFAEILAQQGKEGEGKQQHMDLFRGVFFIADLHKKTTWNTIVYPDNFKYFSKFLVGKLSEEEAFSNQNYQRIKLEDPEFERHFEVYGTDQVESRYILSSALMARMVDFKRKTNKAIQFSFKDSKIYFAIHHSNWKELFRPPLFSNVQDFKLLENYFSEIKLMIEVVKDLNLNSKI